MSGDRSRHDHDPAPGIAPGADVFARRPRARSRDGARNDAGGASSGPVPLAELVAALPETQRPRGAQPGAAPGEAPVGGTGPAFDQPGEPLAGQESLFGGDARKRRPRKPRQPATATQRAIGLLSRREHSRKELTRKLVQKGMEPAEVEQAVESLARAGWQDERRFAESLVRSRASTGHGPIHIRAELGTHDLPSEIREQALEDFEGDWLEIASDFVRRRFGRIDDARLRQRKAADWLIRRGFPGDIVRAASRFDPDD